jgi:hypothetical protein
VVGDRRNFAMFLAMGVDESEGRKYKGAFPTAMPRNPQHPSVHIHTHAENTLHELHITDSSPIHIYTHIYIYIYIHIHTYTYARLTYLVAVSAFSSTKQQLVGVLESISQHLGY